MLTLKNIKSTYGKIKKMAHKSFYKNDCELSLNQIAICANIAYNFNWIYADNDLENLLAGISSRVITPTNYTPRKGRLVFYDYFGWDHRGLTEQYIKALNNLGQEYLYIFENFDEKRSRNILNLLVSNPKVTIYYASDNISKIEKIKSIYNVICEYAPEKALLQLHPASVIAITVFNQLQAIARYNINLTDHAFWLGTGCIDYNIEFRPYGSTVSLEKRGFKKEQLFVLPYYPIIECDNFRGLPSEIPPTSVKIFTGGTYYKMYGDKGKFFDIIKRLLNDNPSAILIVAGVGDILPFQKFIERNELQNRIFLIGHRSDITHIFENCDIYLGTYPITGGLMSQYAAITGKYILSYTDPRIQCNSIESLLYFGIKDDMKITCYDLDTFFKQAQKLIEDKSYREKCSEGLRDCIITEDQFNSDFKDLIERNKNRFPIECVEIDYKKFTEIYLEVENDFFYAFKWLILTDFKLKSIYLFPKVVYASLCSEKLRELMKKKLYYRKKFFFDKLFR